jgi:hypothetical protein
MRRRSPEGVQTCTARHLARSYAAVPPAGATRRRPSRRAVPGADLLIVALGRGYGAVVAWGRRSPEGVCLAVSTWPCLPARVHLAVSTCDGPPGRVYVGGPTWGPLPPWGSTWRFCPAASRRLLPALGARRRRAVRCRLAAGDQPRANVRITRPVRGLGANDVDLRGTRSPCAASSRTSSADSGGQMTAVPPGGVTLARSASPAS